MRIAVHPRGEKTTSRFDARHVIEIACLLQNDYLVMNGTNMLLPERAKMKHIHRILDVGCGAGGWTTRVARNYPRADVIGIDDNQTFLEYARVHSWLQKVNNIKFQLMDFQHLDFPDNFFDFISLRLMGGYFFRDDWIAFLRECQRITRDKGSIYLVECEISITNSFACEHLNALLTKALSLLGHSFSPDGRHLGIIPTVAHFLQEAHFSNVQNTASVVDISANMPTHDAFAQDFMFTLESVEEYMVSEGLIDHEELKGLYQQAQADMSASDFCGFWLLTTMWAHKSAGRQEIARLSETSMMDKLLERWFRDSNR